jgi:NAD-dependent SIR2 family protein deacetylase
MKHDQSSKPDALIVLGTLLSIKTLNSWVKQMASEAKQQDEVVVLVNKTEVTGQVKWSKFLATHIVSSQ